MQAAPASYTKYTVHEVYQASRSTRASSILVPWTRTVLYFADTGISMYLRLSATPGSEQTLPREAPARRVVHRRPFFRRQIVGLLCGKSVEPPRGGGRPSGARESHLFFGDDSPPPRGASGPVPGRSPLHAPRSPSRARHPFIRRQIVGLLCGWDATPQRGRGRPRGARESHLFSGGLTTKIFSKIHFHLDIATTTTTEEHYIIRIQAVYGRYMYQVQQAAVRAHLVYYSSSK